MCQWVAPPRRSVSSRLRGVATVVLITKSVKVPCVSHARSGKNRRKYHHRDSRDYRATNNNNNNDTDTIFSDSGTWFPASHMRPVLLAVVHPHMHTSGTDSSRCTLAAHSSHTTHSVVHTRGLRVSFRCSDMLERLSAA